MKHHCIILLLALALVGAAAQAQSAAPTTPQLTLSTSPASGTASPSPAPVLAPLPATTTAATIPAREVKVPADPAAAFAAGVAAYGKNDYAAAREFFAGAEKTAISPALEFNLGNACYQTEDYGPAILHYLRALSLNPRDPDARQNLALARKGANVTAPEQTRLDVYANFFARNTWAWITSLAGWAALYLAFFPRMYRWRGIIPWLLCATMLAVAVAGGVGFRGAQSHAHEGVVLHPNTAVCISPTANSEPLAMLQPGEIAETLERHGNYFKIHTPAGLLGWVEATHYSPVWN